MLSYIIPSHQLSVYTTYAKKNYCRVYFLFSLSLYFYLPYLSPVHLQRSKTFFFCLKKQNRLTLPCFAYLAKRGKEGGLYFSAIFIQYI